ncbi:two-component system, OmpR family, sensor histidine kinase BaeS [Candidatus Magnetomoraceae bacterium gMMP-15]
MKVRLVYKFFIAFVLIALMIVILFTIALQIFVYQNFSEYVAKVELEKLNHLTEELKEEYLTHIGWEHLLWDPRSWQDMLEYSLRQDHGILVSKDQRDFSRRPPPSERPMLSPPEGPIRPIDPLQIGRSLCLFDANMHTIAGNAESSEGYVLRAIRLDDRIVGWLGLRMISKFYHPLDFHYIKDQINVFYLIIGVILAIALLIAFFLSNHLLEPVRHLTEGTKALATYEFDTRIHVRSNDELGQLASDFNQMAETLEKYEQMRTQWITDISHELRTPLSVLRGEIEAMQDGIREMSHTTLDSLHSEVIRLGKLVDDLHLLSLADIQNLYMEKKPIHPLMILSNTLNLFQHHFRQRQIDIKTDIDLPRPVIILGDVNRLTQFFINLLENTLRYTDTPGVLKISAEFNEEYLTLWFEDSPPSVPEDALEQIFDRLYRVDKSRSRALGGSGLGLSICRQIITSHGGTIRADHAQTGGLAIIIELPIYKIERSKRKKNGRKNDIGSGR